MFFLDSQDNSINLPNSFMIGVLVFILYNAQGPYHKRLFRFQYHDLRLTLLFDMYYVAFIIKFSGC